VTGPAGRSDRTQAGVFGGFLTDAPPPAELANRLAGARVASRLSARDLSVFPPAEDPAVAEAIRNRLGWLSAPDDFPARAAALVRFAHETRRNGLVNVYLLGMGGSSLCAEVLCDVLADGPPCRLVVLDTTDERTVRHATEALDPATSLFLVASKSGSTIEVSALERHFWSVMHEAIGRSAGRHFAAITDPGSPLVALASERKYRHTFENPPDIGGRYSALSLFGLVPAALLGLDLGRLLDAAGGMAESCRDDTPDNPGLALGAFMAAEAAAGRDKLTLLLPPPLASLGVWVEQLVAESTGKRGRGVLPIVGEPLGAASEYGADRAFVVVLTTDTGDLDASARTLEAAGHPVFRITTTTSSLGREFFRWEFATAVAGAALGVNPFDEPDVKAAKERTAAQLEVRRRTGSFHLDPPLLKQRGYARREHGDVARGGSGRYLAVLDFLPADWRRPTIIERLRGAIRRRTGLATTHGIGPRYLHSTGQYHKGGPNTGLFVLLTAADESITPVPDTDYSFSVLKQAQALGDFDALIAAGRAVIHYHVDDPAADYSDTLERVLKQLRG
jgi:glucose-6-phosphate isomerase